MTIRASSELSDILRPMDDEFIATVKRVSEMEDDGSVQLDDDGTLTLDLPVAIFDTPTPYETKPTGEVNRMKKTRGFRALYRASERLAKLGAQPSLSHSELGQIFVARALLTYAREEAESDPNVTPDLSLRIQVNEALSSITAYSGSIIEVHEQPRMVEAYEGLFFTNAFDELTEVGHDLMKKYQRPLTESERKSYNGFAHELVFHLLQYRQQSALRFSTAASVYDDYFRDGQRFDATAYNLKQGREKIVDLQIKTYPEQLQTAPEDGFRVIYGTTDLHNVSGDAFWHDTMQANRNLPTLSALLDEAAGDTTSSAKLDQITARLHSRLFS